MVVQECVSLKHFNTFGIDAQARYYARIDDVSQLRNFLLSPEFQSFPQLILGGGSNVLLRENFGGIVLHMAIEDIVVLREDYQHVWLKVGAGINWHQLVLHCIRQGYAGLENLSLIPGTVGAAPVHNIGAYGVALSDVIEFLEAIEVRSGQVHTFQKKDCAFGYRDSIFKNSLQGRYIITSVCFRLYKQPRLQITYDEIKATLKKMDVQKLSIQAISDVVIYLRKKKLPDPARLGNAGSFFKNPIITREQFIRLQNMYSNMPGYAQTRGQVKVSAAWLIEQCGWKGWFNGRVGVYSKHALVLVNYGAGTGQDIYQLMLAIQQSVKDRFSIELTPEVQVVGGY